MSSNIKEKGEYLGICNITRCETGLPATWYNHSTRLYYCAECAGRLNSDIFNERDAHRMFGHDLLTEGEFKGNHE